MLDIVQGWPMTWTASSVVMLRMTGGEASKYSEARWGTFRRTGSLFINNLNVYRELNKLY